MIILYFVVPSRTNRNDFRRGTETGDTEAYTKYFIKVEIDKQPVREAIARWESNDSVYNQVVEEDGTFAFPLGLEDLEVIVDIDVRSPKPLSRYRFPIRTADAYEIKGRPYLVSLNSKERKEVVENLHYTLTQFVEDRDRNAANGTFSSFKKDLESRVNVFQWECYVVEALDGESAKVRRYRISVDDKLIAIATCYVSVEESFPQAQAGQRVIIQGELADLFPKMITLNNCRVLHPK
jgi:hypothetical protein